MQKKPLICVLAVALALWAAADANAVEIITHWTFDTNFNAINGTDLNDAVVANSDPTIVGAGGVVGGYVDFDGNDWLKVDPKTDYDLGTGSIAYSMWFRDAGTAGSDRSLAGGATANTEDGWGMFLDTSGADAGFGAAASDGTGRTIQKANANGAVNVFDGEWHHVAVNMSISPAYGVEVYVDGVLETTIAQEVLGGGVGAGDNNVTHSLSSFFIGSNGSATRALMGDLDDLAVMAGNLSAGEVSRIYNGGLNGVNVNDALAVPEPATATLGLLALGGLGVMTRRRSAYRDTV